jgi:hypothetical protein
MLLGLAVTLSDSTMAYWGPGIAAGIGFGYLTLSTAAALPLLMGHLQRINMSKVQT